MFLVYIMYIDVCNRAAMTVISISSILFFQVGCPDHSSASLGVIANFLLAICGVFLFKFQVL